MNRVTQEIEINAPVEVVFDWISNFSAYPRWLQGIQRVRLTAPHRSRWTATTPSGEAVEWEAETTVFEPDRKVAWRSVEGDVRAFGEAVIEATNHDTTVLRLQLGYEADESTAPGVVNYLMGDDPAAQLQESLARFAQIVEFAEAESGARAWPSVAAPAFVSGYSKPIRRAQPLVQPGEAADKSVGESAGNAAYNPRVSVKAPEPAAGRAVINQLHGVQASRDVPEEEIAATDESDEEYVFVRHQPVAGYVALAVLGLLIVGSIVAFVSWMRADRSTARVVAPTPEATRRAPAASVAPVVVPSAGPTATPTVAPSPEAGAEETPSPNAASTTESDAEAEARDEVADTVKRWVAATNARDVNSQMTFYAPTLRRYYLQSNVPRGAVSEDKSARFAEADRVHITASEPEITFEDAGRTARVRLRKRYEIEKQGQSERGEVVQELVLARQGDEWRIVSERDLQVLR